MRKPTFWFPTWSDTNQAVQLQKMARGLKFRIRKVEGLYYLCSENKGADQLRGYREADLRLCFRICKMLVFSRRGSIYSITVPASAESGSHSLHGALSAWPLAIHSSFLPPQRLRSGWADAHSLNAQPKSLVLSRSSSYYIITCFRLSEHSWLFDI